MAGTYTIREGGTTTTKEGATVPEIGARVTTLSQNLADAIKADTAEAEDAMKHIGKCKKTNKNFKDDIEKVITAANKAMEDLKTLYTSKFEPKDELVETLLSGTAEPWFDVGVSVKSEIDVVDQHLRLDDWSSQGAQQYKQAVQGQHNALQELHSLANANGEAVQNVALVNAGIFTATLQTLNAVQIDTSPADFSINWRDRRFLVRTDSARAKLENVNRFLETLLSANGAWYPSAQQISENIMSVSSSGVNLGADGVWPNAKANSSQSAASVKTMDDIGRDALAAGDGAGSGEGASLK